MVLKLPSSENASSDQPTGLFDSSVEEGLLRSHSDKVVDMVDAMKDDATSKKIAGFKTSKGLF